MNLEYNLQLVDGALDIPISFPYDVTQTALIFLGYFDSHVELKVEGMDVTAGTSENYPGKLVYRHMSGIYSNDLVFKVETVGDSGGSGTTLLLVLGVLLILIGVVLYFYMVQGPAARRGRRGRGHRGR
jgi:hypothetical protein